MEIDCSPRVGATHIYLARPLGAHLLFREIEHGCRLTRSGWRPLPHPCGERSGGRIMSEQPGKGPTHKGRFISRWQISMRNQHPLNWPSENFVE